jgi:hypothetical protein
MSPQPSGSPDSGKPGSPLRNQIPVVSLADFRARLDTRQVESELDAIFRESPEFGRTLAHRLSPFLETRESGSLTLIGAGGEVAVFGDPANQQVLKLCGPPARCRFGWVIRRGPDGILTLAPGGLDEILDRLSLFEALFSSGISVDCIGENETFLAFRQPFILGRHPTMSELDGHMRSLGWTPHQEPCSGETLERLTWKKGAHLATDVRPENALVAESTGVVHPIDFIVAGKEIA